MMKEKLTVAVVGAGYVSRHHLAALKRTPRVEVIAVLDLDSAAAARVAAEFGVPRSGASLDELRDAPPDAVYVLTPPASHCALALAALELGCHVFVEKPMAETVEDCDRMIEAARRSGRALSVNHSDRFDPVVLQALAAVHSGRIGEVVNVDFIRGSEYPAYAGGPLPALYRHGSYPFQDLGVHGLYLLEAFLGPIARADIRFRSSGRDLQVQFDEWHVHAESAQGVGRLHLSWNARPMQSRLIVQGTRGWIEVDRFLQTCRINPVLPGPKFIGMVFNAVRNGFALGFGVPLNVLRFATGRLRPSPGIQASAAAFAQSVQDGRAPPVTAEEGRRPLALMAAACKAADSARTATLAARLAPLPPAEILVTGAGGFLGRALVLRLVDSGKPIRILVRRRPHWLGECANVHAVVGDLGDPELVRHAVRGTRVVYHLGAAMKGGQREFEAGTVWGTRNVIDACLEAKVERLVYVSSMSVLDHAGRDARVPVTEQSAYEPLPAARGLYTQTKLLAEQLVLAAMREQSLPAVVLRPGQIFGPGAQATTPNAVVALAGRWIVVGLDDPALPLVYVDDVVDALLLAASRPAAAGQLFHVVDPTSITRSQYLQAARAALGPRLRTVRLPTFAFLGLSHGVALLGRLLKRAVPLTPYRVRSLRPLANFDMTKSRDELGWTPRVGVHAGLARTFADSGAATAAAPAAATSAS